MAYLKQINLSICLISVFVLIGCKKIPEYGISEGMKKYFLYKPGSYWIYKDDLTGLTDSTYVLYYTDYFADIHGDYKIEMKIEWLDIYFQSKLFYTFSITRTSCDLPDYMMVSSKRDTVPPGEQQSIEGPVAYCPSWPENQKILAECEIDSVFFYRTMPIDTVNNLVYHNIIYSENQSRDSSITNLFYHQRKITFAENAGIIKFYDIDRRYNIHRSYSLVRYKIVQ